MEEPTQSPESPKSSWDNPLWMPVGSVRAILAILMVAVSCYNVVFGQFILPEWYVQMVIVVVAAYFGKDIISGVAGYIGSKTNGNTPK